MDIYGIKTCDSCRKAIKALSDARFVDLRKDGISPALLSRAYAE
ncbi:MAG: arsenate reductase, partial [Rhodobacteraceae bacterium]|nr:arsenate reductase [Paracoccaceae bacterium]